MYEDGRIVRAAQCTITLSGENVTSKTLDFAIHYKYDKDGKLIFKYTSEDDLLNVGGTFYEYDKNDGTVVIRNDNGKTVISHSKTDSFGRKEFEELQLSTGFVSRRFSYHTGAVNDVHKDNNALKSTPTTNLVSEILLSDGHVLAYEYDAEERITKVTDTDTTVTPNTSTVTEYTYDALGQLLTETRNGVAVNTMSYDNYGNITQKNGKSYTYDATWKDLLTSYDGQTITYDAQGNPTSYLGHTLAWEKGRQLKSYDSNTYTYNANGIRTSKTVNGVKHTYLLDGAKILRETWGENAIVTLWDNEDAICGIKYNGDAYYFLKNLQGDVVAITGDNGDVVARYSYDAWGVPTIDDPSVAIATINPFRYRGYYYDTETGLYYLQSRYYNPTVGRFINADEPEVITLAYISHIVNQYSYCDNNPAMESDQGGYISFSSIKQTIKKLADNIKKFVADLVSYIKKKFEQFSSKVSCHFNKGYLMIPTAPVGYLIDAVIGTISGLIKGAILKGSFTLVKLWFKSNRPALLTFIKNTVVPLLKNTDALFDSFLKYIASRFKRKCAWTITKSKIEDRILGNYDFYKWISAVSSIGSFIATFLDILDGKWDDCLAI